MKPFRIFNRNFKKKYIKKIYEESIKNKPSVGIDGINIDVFDKKLDDEVEIINRKILDKTYNFSFYKERLISKGRNKFPRVISIPTIRDKIVLKSIFNTLYEIYQDNLSNELIHTKIDKIKYSVENGKFDSFIKIDIENFYPTINHEILLKILRKKTKKTEFLNLISKAITQVTVKKSHKDIRKYSNDVGVPQGLSISNILASIYFTEFDKQHTDNINIEYDYYRYVDDILILCNKKDIQSIYEIIKDDMDTLSLTIHEMGKSQEKTDYGSIKDGFYFLGYLYSSRLISVRNSSINNLHNSIIDIFTQYKHSSEKDIDLLHWKLNLKITGCRFKDKKYGWLYFFSQINDKTLLFKLDVYVKKIFKTFAVPYDKTKVRKFIRTYFEILKNRTETNYIPNFSELTKSQKRNILESIFKKYDLPSDKIEEVFDSIIYKSIKEMEKDIQMY
ncbi:reverse transcriptase domain-containing protein [Sulfurimonas sp.]